MLNRNMNQLFPPKPTFTEENLPDQAGRVFIVTGGALGIGLELCKILYGSNATIYIATRSSTKIAAAIKTIKSLLPSSRGRLESLVLDLADLTTIKPATELFLAKETRLDVLVHNAGVMMPPSGSKTAQDHELQIGTNALGPYLLTRCLEERLRDTSRLGGTPRGSVRVVWVASMISLGAPKGGVVWDDANGAPKLSGDAMSDYMQGKVGCVFLADEFAKRVKEDGIVSVSVNPGLVKTELQRFAPAAMGAVMVCPEIYGMLLAVTKLIEGQGVIFKGARHGAYSELFAACSPDVSMEKSGLYIIPWGRFGCIPEDIAEGFKAGSSGGKSLTRKFWNWCERETLSFQ
ncbi:hypothetical protein CORC01_02695 [Colletotrichum orchidophilum]|uniref:Short-chain dehydrogenase n=1 Tax=Colletotrichum orchidophilum TaxID=1209926 RepID=A0A1G4BLD4_9PEZI|nr:uncharacterized protein CORC01_02695 [Colletotrichum orchidophilum]OHF02116.1 hypothetical protein CORC01_02695 [Colletotrichum orchidophilum]